jgi:hypothetical protein
LWQNCPQSWLPMRQHWKQQKTLQKRLLLTQRHWLLNLLQQIQQWL